MRRRRTMSAMAPTASNPKAEGSGTGNGSPWKASPVGYDNPEVKVLCIPSGVISVILPLVPFATNRSPAPLKASPIGLDNPEEKIILCVPSGVNSRMSLFQYSPANRLPSLLKASPKGLFNPEAKVLRAPPGVISVMLPAQQFATNRSPALLKASPIGLQLRSKDALSATWREFIDVAAAVIRHKQILRLHTGTR